MRSPRSAIGWLLVKEWRELVASRAFWVMLLAIGPLVGVSFISAVQTYAEASGLHGTALGVGEAFAPLVGIWAPTFSACEIAAAFLLPFVGIRLVAGDLQHGAMKLELQHRMRAITRIGAKTAVLIVGWAIASLAPLAAIVLWRSYGGTIYAPELAAVIGGHFLNALLTIALAAATAAVTEHPSTAAILTLAVTVGTWVLNFIAAVHGGIWERAAGYTPTAMVAEFQHGLVRLDVVSIATLLVIAGLGFAAIWIRLGVARRRRSAESTALLVLTAVAIAVTSAVPQSWDLSEARANSFARSDEAVLARISEPLSIEVHLAPEDPRRSDLDRRALAKLRRIVSNLRIDYVSETSIGIFEQTKEGYGEIRYRLGGREVVSRATTVDGVLDAIYEVAGMERPPESDNDVFRGHPLPVAPRGAAVTFYVVWPAVVLTIAMVLRRRTG